MVWCCMVRFGGVLLGLSVSECVLLVVMCLWMSFVIYCVMLYGLFVCLFVCVACLCVLFLCACVRSCFNVFVYLVCELSCESECVVAVFVCV